MQLARNVERIAGLEGDLKNALAIGVELRAQMDRERAQGIARENALRDGSQALDVQLAALRQELEAVVPASSDWLPTWPNCAATTNACSKHCRPGMDTAGYPKRRWQSTTCTLVAIRAQHAAHDCGSGSAQFGAADGNRCGASCVRTSRDGAGGIAAQRAGRA